MLVFLAGICLSKYRINVTRKPELRSPVNDNNVCKLVDETLTSQVSFNIVTVCNSLTNFLIINTSFNCQTANKWGNCIWVHGTSWKINILDCNFSSNVSEREGAVDIEGQDINFTNNMFTNCHTTTKNSQETSYGGSIYILRSVTDNATVRLVDNTFKNSYSEHMGAIGVDA